LSQPTLWLAPHLASGGSEIDELDNVGDVLQPIEALDKLFDLVRRDWMRRRLAITPKLGEVVVPTEGLGGIAVDDIEPDGMPSPVPQFDHDLYGGEGIDVAHVPRFDRYAQRQCRGAGIAIGLVPEILKPDASIVPTAAGKLWRPMQISRVLSTGGQS
jgi:hypothetical protein